MKVDHFSPDIVTFIEVLERWDVRYLLIGGEAVIYHGYPRLTGDVDIAFHQTTDNIHRLWSALVEFWNHNVPALDSAEELLEAGVVIQFGRPPNRLDLLADPDGLDFDLAWERRVVEPVGDSGLHVNIVGLDDLILTKRAAGRHKDLDDIEHLLDE